MAYLAAITSDAGVPLFIRTKGNLPQLSFPVLGSLNGVHVYATSMKTSLVNCTNGGAKVIWKCFHDSITLILVSPDDSPSTLHSSHLLELVFSAMVLLVGLHELESISNVERLKKDLRCCYPLLDALLEGIPLLLSPLTQCADVIAMEDPSLLQSCLDAFTESAQSNYGCLSLHSHILVASESWWELSSLEISLLSLFLSSLPPATSRDIPIYLPRASSRTAHRLLIFSLLEGVSVSVLCGPEPSLKAVQELVGTFWSPLMETLQLCVHNFPRCVPLRMNFDPSVLAFCLVNLGSGRSVLSLQPTTQTETHKTTLSAGFQGEIDLTKKYAYLCRFYRTVVDNLLPAKIESEREGGGERGGEGGGGGGGGDHVTGYTLREVIPHKVIETYMCAKKYKAYALHKDGFNLFVLFMNTTPTFALRKLSQDLFQLLTSDRAVSHSLRPLDTTST